jgi:octanoyl-[GcvH]:protein N-octanoyltransferase
VLVRSAGGGATAADRGTFGFSIIRPADERESGRSIRDRYDEAANLVLAVFSRLGMTTEVGEVRDEFCPGDHSIRIGDRESGMKVVGIVQRITRCATSVGGIVLVEGERELACVLGRVYGTMQLPFRPESVGSLRRAGYEAGTQHAIEAFAAEAARTYGAVRVPVDENTLELAAREGGQYLIA